MVEQMTDIFQEIFGMFFSGAIYNYNKSVLYTVIDWHRTSDKPLPEPMLI